MKYLIILSLASTAFSARLENVYLPPNSRGAAAGGAGLQAPSGSQYNPGPQRTSAALQQGAGQASAASQAEILRYENEINEEGFHYAYETSDGTKAEQQGRVIPGATEDEGSIQVSGSYSYVGDDGQTYSVTYTADENGYRAEGAHLPTPPPIPEAILKSLKLTAGNTGASGGRDTNYSIRVGTTVQNKFGAHSVSMFWIDSTTAWSYKPCARYDSQRSSYDADKTGY